VSNTTRPAYRVLGVSDECDTCECCGRTNLKATAVLAVLDADGNVEAETYFGRSCAAKAAGWTVKFVGAEVTRVKRINAMLDHLRWGGPVQHPPRPGAGRHLRLDDRHLRHPHQRDARLRPRPP